ncbi:LPS-assembly protein LptD [Massilia arenosa]|uniref:LPS-assembly protein LptD n=1 Tax=Zemynaea arenosa TaxID=2561931 RepID=A0A4Y9S573_9BURK|nr:LPS-assembly protein LptD [Massilia arenosa]TFW15015.1 LPS-assembly protein LptD [Massilia arenosa]
MTWFPASPIPPRRAFALTAIAAAVAGAAHAQTPPAKRTQTDDPDAPIVIRAEEVTGRPERQLNLERDVEITRGQTRIKGDTACYRAVEDEVTAQGHIQMQRFGDRYAGDQLQLNMSTGQGWVLKPQYHLEMNNAQGRATRLEFLNDEQAVVSQGTYSTCEGPNPDWYLTASRLTLDQGRDVGVATSTWVYFKGVPILGAPGMSFSLSGARRSGWLPPSVGLGAKGSGELTVPYYFNIAPNRDLTVAPRLMLSRGVQILLDGRYLGETASGTYNGETALEYLHHDKQTNTSRWLVNSQHAQVLVPGWSYGWVARAASDDLYPSDFSKSINNSAERQLLRELRTDYSTQFWSLSARAQGWQVLQDPAAAADPRLTVPRPYDRLPQVNFHAGRYDVNGFDWAVDSEVTRFDHPTLVRGTREVVQPQVSYPIIRPGFFITPKLLLNATRYQLDGNLERTGMNPYQKQYSRTLGTASLDSGLVFEREARLFGQSVTQTLEPRVFYVYTPYRDQRDFPNFDSAEAGFSFAQLFTENRFIGNDRIADANQVTAALVSRFIESNGAERLRLAVGQRFYIHTPRVFLDNTEHTERRSDLLLAAGGRVTSAWNFDSAIQYNGATHQVYNANYGVQWTPGDKKVINAEYRYTRDSYKNLDVSSQWPIAARWYGVGRVSYSLRDRKLLESLVGLEYKADCWVFRMGAQRFVTAAQTVSTPMFFQLELNGLSKLGFGSNPLESFYKSIPGYSRLNPASR